MQNAIVIFDNCQLDIWQEYEQDSWDEEGNAYYDEWSWAVEAEFHIMMSLIERMVHADNADDDDMQRKLLRSTACQLMRAAVLQRTIIPLLETTTVPEEHLENYSKITQKLVESLHDTFEPRLIYNLT